jgi:sulfate permease, SulP family
MNSEKTRQPQTANGDSDRVPKAPSTMQQWFPGGVWLRNYQWGKYTAVDLIAAVSVAALLIPESMGYATVAGVPPQLGLYAAPLALIGYALLGGSRLLVFGAAGSVAAVSGTVVSGLSSGDSGQAVTFTAALALATGVIFLVAGLARLGWISNFISKAVMAGFITAMAIQIIVGQLGNLTGVSAGSGDTFSKLWEVITKLSDWSLVAAAIGVGAIGLIFAIQRFIPKLPAALTAVAIASVIVAAFDPNITLVPEIPTGLPSPSVPGGISASDWLTLLLGGAVVALVGFSEGWGASAKVAEKTHDDLNANQEFRAYGVGNMGAGILGGLVVTGSLDKSALAMESGAKTQMFNVFQAVVVVAVLLVLSPALKWLPQAALAAVVITAMWGSANPAKLIRIWKIDRVDFALGLITGIIVLVFNLLPAMITGIILSITYLVYRNSFPSRAELGRIEKTGDFEIMHWELADRSGSGNPNAHPVDGVIVYRFDAPLIFSNAEAFKDTVRKLLIDAGAKGKLPKTMVIDCEEMFYTDFTGADALSGMLRYAQRYGVELSLARLHSQARAVLESAGTINELGEHRLFDTVRDAVDAATAKSAYAGTPAPAS